MELLSKQVQGYLEKASWIRKMFEAGSELKQKFGAENVFDFSLGNPDLPPPPEIGSALRELADRADQPFALGYMPNAGLPEARKSLAGFLAAEQQVDIAPEDIVLTCGAAGGINAFFRAVLEPGDQVVCPAPYFVEYGFYAENFQGRLVPVKTRPLTFDLDLEALEGSVTARTRAVLINSPNNPSGRVYTQEEISGLARILEAKSREAGRPIFLISDEPYRFLTYDQAEVPSVLAAYRYSMVVSSFSKSLSMAGERVGYIAVNPGIPEKSELLNGLTLTNRILGFVNAPVIGQILMQKALQVTVDRGIYEKRRQAMAGVLSEAGLEFSMPGGGFYFFPKAPGGDDQAFVQNLFKENVLAVPGTGFGYPGYVRFAFCVPDQVITSAGPALKRASSQPVRDMKTPG
ncbi:pyridoxal phosphate-dependent aminotransferase [Desulfonatronovibrio hydrogenovorans]|uniref:pyridoxal phosphate-dependent aminotransferase n=1 Tax=Desulfonatronovibrio hydrogenovorans TaxID=53245 RepID=UPI00048B07C2|nr:pyridoxal phosphate-dependent aminotransferase [Desulfonatronovibrio hydrogenovorans]